MNFKLATYATLKRKLRGILGLIPVSCIALQLSFLGFILAAPIPSAYSQSTSVLTGSLSGVSGNESISNYDSISSDSVSTTDLTATGTITADTISATSTIRSATFIFSASGIPLYIGDTSNSDSGKALIYDATSNAINLLPITNYLDFATVGNSLNFNDISDVSVEFASEGWVPAWNAASEIWEATPAASTSTETLLENYLPLAGGTMSGDISMATHTISDVSQVNGLTSLIWIPSATDSMTAGEMRFWVSE